MCIFANTAYNRMPPAPTFAAQQSEVDGLLKKAEKLLRPLSFTRADLERVLDRKAGID